ncbi:tubulin monoglycylase TTLL3 isoform X3 [Esox lucius]|uniref:tubulin monoglycylase TTLL3 isoform X3 n=1 Tax=Esox lucius TaxID=8010 RepID=UPI00147724E8|nr:tubulin monoglycylase TTLL3 isoform X3 [Esox lucius]
MKSGLKAGIMIDYRHLQFITGCGDQGPARSGVSMDASKPGKYVHPRQREEGSQHTGGHSAPYPDGEKGQQQVSTTSGEERVKHSLLNFPVINPERLLTAQVLVDKAVKMRKVFSIQGPYPVVRAALRVRGWVERRLPRPTRSRSHSHGHEDNGGDDAGDSDDDRPEEGDSEDPDDMYDLMSRLVRNETSYFYWTTRRDAIDNRSLQREQMTNHYSKASTFTTKVGLCVNLRGLRWFDAADPDSFFPRCYRLGVEDEKQAFIEDYRRTVCTSLLQYVVERSQGDRGEGGGIAISTDQSCQSQKKTCKRQPMSLAASRMIDSALLVCQDFLDSVEHKHIDNALETPPPMTEQQWPEFIDNYNQVVNGGAEIQDSVHEVKSCQAMLRRLREVSPQLDIDGVHNIWIVKPGAKSRGRGIMCANRLDDILGLVDNDSTVNKDSKWVVQKYLERPLLVHGTKFDLRQWFLVTDWNPLTVWFYKECYLRFSTQPFSLETLDSSVHLCNTSIQKHLQPSRDRHPDVPEDSMWSCDQFRAFLSSHGLAAQWGSVIVPGMKKALVHALQTAQDLVESRRGSFELYGADFMLGRDLRPWLIEINASPAMTPSTAVMSRLCAAVQEDTLRVVLDRRLDGGAHTGGFQLIHKQPAVEVHPYAGVKFLIKGSEIKRPHPRPRKAFNPGELRTKRLALGRCPKSKQKEAVAENPKLALEAVVQQLTFSGIRAQPPPSPERPLGKGSRRLQRLDLGPASPLQLAHRAQSRCTDFWWRHQVVRPCSVKPCPPATSDSIKGPLLPLEVISLRNPDRELPSLLLSTPVVPLAGISFQDFNRTQNSSYRVIRTRCVGRGTQKHV